MHVSPNTRPFCHPGMHQEAAGSKNTLLGAITINTQCARDCSSQQDELQVILEVWGYKDHE